MGPTVSIKSMEDLTSYLKQVLGPEALQDALGSSIKEMISEEMKSALAASNQTHKDLEALVARMDQEQHKKERQTLQAARVIRAMAQAKGRPGEAIDVLNKGGYGQLAKALSEGTGSAGGYMISPQMGEFVDRLSADAIVRRLGARVIPMPRGSITLPGGSSGPTAYWVGENSAMSSSQPTMRTVTLAAKKLAVVIPVSNELLADGGPMVDQWIETEAMTQAALAEDLAFIRGAGGENSPRGMLYRAASANKFSITHAAAAATQAEIHADLGRAINKLASGNVPMVRCGWAMSKRSEWHLKSLLNSLGLPAYDSEMSKGNLRGFPFASTTQIPNNLSVVGSADESEIYLADFFSCVIGQTQDVEIKVMDGAAYYDSSSGAVVSGLSNDQTVVVLSKRVDFASLHQGADIAIIQAVDWGV